MAKSSNLREFQEAILQKLKEATSSGAAESSSRLGVMVGEYRLLINLTAVTEVLPVPTMQPVPLTQPWFLGVANVRGNLYNITDLQQFIGKPSLPKTIHSRILLLNSPNTTQAALVVTSLVGLRNIEAMKVRQKADANRGLLDLFIKQVYEDENQQTWEELNIEALVQHQDFIQPTI
ncbi:MAG TPA: chemotaxis protein CheW [Methylophilaceae bacterium]|nr:chemotaxis protein CheW [Methylophilaceae bacterium]HPX87824.1 chemotaxis protein CheW [Methylophilaceae bacterium]HQO15613.1 chemotaxis protein CheW [Methylotenera sp.]